MSVGSHVSLIKLGQQLPFEIDDAMKKKICFAETLVISCGHSAGVFEDGDGSDSDWTCSETTEPAAAPDEIHEELPTEIKDYVPVPEEDANSDDDNGFHMFFFPDCNAPKPSQHSEASLMTVDGWPAINPAAQKPRKCTCIEDKKDKDKCDCFTKLPCKCGAKKRAECICAKLETICICDENKPEVKCKCNPEDVCTCFPGPPHPVCTCDKVEKPCVCYPGVFPKPVCDCKGKPTFGYLKALEEPLEDLEEGDEMPEEESTFESGMDGEYYEGEFEMEPGMSVSKYGTSESQMEAGKSVSKYAKSEIMDPTKSVSKYAKSEILEPGKSVSKYAKSEIMDPAKSVSKYAKSEIMDPAKSVSKYAKSEILEPGKSVSKYAKSELQMEPKKSVSKYAKSEAQLEPRKSVSIYSKSQREMEPKEPCICQKPAPPAPCLCLKGKECTCKQEACICGVQKTCVCEPTDSKEIVCKSESSKSICSCPELKECTCGAEDGVCKCFPKPALCVCGDPANCRCKRTCECVNPCICDTAPDPEENECVCIDKVKKKDGWECQCICKNKDEKPNQKLKKARAGKQGYRWCHDIDPRHTYFDYGYGRHDKIDYKEQERERFKVLGLYDDKDANTVDAECPVHGSRVLPTFKKKIRKPSIDCCSGVGGISINVETLGEEKDKFLVQVVSHSSKEGAKTGTKLISIVDCNLHTMEENRIEHITKLGLTKERRSYMAICETGYYNKITRTCGERNVVKRFYHTFDVAHDFLLEGSNVVLIRYFGLRRHVGKVKTLTVLMDGTICESNYVCLGVNHAIVNGKPMFVYKVERHIIDPYGFVRKTLTTLTLKGFIVSHEWDDSNYIFHLNPLLNVIPDEDSIEQHAPLRENWRKDLQLLSDYLDFKSSRTSEGGRYVAENGELTATIRDYLQAVLLLKPADVVHFTRHYFRSAISSLDLPHDEYFDPCPKHVRYFYMEE